MKDLMAKPLAPSPRGVIQGKNVSVQVLDRELAQSITHETPYAMIRVTDPSCYLSTLSEDPNRVGVLELYFCDIPHDLENKGKWYNAITAGQAKQIAEFYNEQHEHTNLFVIHCDAGISRSAAIAAAIWAYEEGPVNFFFERFAPNKTVYQMVSDAIA